MVCLILEVYLECEELLELLPQLKKYLDRGIFLAPEQPIFYFFHHHFQNFQHLNNFEELQQHVLLYLYQNQYLADLMMEKI